MTNGAAWYSLRGTLQDYGYIGRGIMEVTLEMGCEKTVHSQQTMAIYGQNRKSLFDFLEFGLNTTQKIHKFTQNRVQK